MSTTIQSRSQVEFYKEFLVSRQTFKPQDFGVDMDLGAFTDLMADSFNAIFRGRWTIDELLLRPREAMAFCDDVRRKHGFYDLPDDIILRAVMRRRKNPVG